MIKFWDNHQHLILSLCDLTLTWLLLVGFITGMLYNAGSDPDHMWQFSSFAAAFICLLVHIIKRW